MSERASAGQIGPRKHLVPLLAGWFVLSLAVVGAAPSPAFAWSPSLTVVLAGTGTGTVTSNPAGIDCGSSCEAEFDGTVTLSAVAALGSTFDGWIANEGACPGTGDCTLTLNDDRTVTAVFDVLGNHEPAGTDNTVTTAEDTPYTFSAADFGFSDPDDDPADNLLAVVIDSWAGAPGSLTINGVPVVAGMFVGTSGIDAGALVFTPDADEFGSPYVSFTFRVWDDGGTANGGVDVDQSPNTMTINVASATDEPTLKLVKNVVTNDGGNEDADDWTLYADAVASGQASAGYSLTCAVRSDGLLDCWGWNSHGQVSSPNASTDTFIQVSAGGSHTCSLRSDGQLECWGENFDGQVAGPNASTDTFSQVSAGYSHTCAVYPDGQLECWGLDVYGQVSGPNASSDAFSQVSAGYQNTCALRTDGQLQCWGNDGNGKVSGPNATADTFRQVSAGQNHTCAVHTDGQLECWGQNGDGQVSGPNANTNTFSQVSAGSYHTCAVHTDGQLECWGNNGSGRVSGPNASNDVFSEVGAGDDHTCALRTDGQLDCWGSNGSGQVSGPNASSDTYGTSGGAADRNFSNAGGSGVFETVYADTGYVLSESTVAGYVAADWSCDGGSLVGSTITLASGENVTCTITNDDVAPTLTLVKNVVNDNGGSADADDFGLTIGGNPTTSGVAYALAANTPYAIDEAGLGGYTFVSITGDPECPALLGGTVTLDEGDAVTCTITNDDLVANSAPAGTDETVTTGEDTPYTFSAADFGFSDPLDTPANELLAVKVTTLPGEGSLTNNATLVSAGDFVSVIDIEAGKLVFTPAANASGSPYTSFTFQVQDDGGTDNGGVDLDQSANTLTINVTPANDRPTATNLSAPETYTEDVPLDLVDIVVGDVDSATLTVTLNMNNAAAGSFNTATVGSTTSIFSPVGGVWTATGPIAELNTLLAGLTFTPSANFNAGFGIGTSVSDGVTPFISGGKTVTGIAVNDAPVLDATKSPALLAQDEDAGAPSGAVGTLVAALVDFASPAGQVDNVTDVDAGALLGIAITAADTANGTWWQSFNDGVTWNPLGAVSDTAALLIGADGDNRLYFEPDSNYSGTFASALTFRAWDQTSGSGGGTADATTNGGSTALSSISDTVSLVINAVNSAPAGSDDTVTTGEDTPYTFSAADFGFSDPDDAPADELLAVKITTLPGVGSLANDGTPLSAGDSVSATDIGAGKLIFTPAANATGSPYASFTFQVQDDGGTANGGVDIDQSPNTLTINVTPAFDAACLAPPFSDIPVDHLFCNAIKWMKNRGISTGFDDGTYRPGIAVTRQAMSAFMTRLAGATLTPCTEPPFADVPISHPFCEEIKWMRDEGISTGFHDDTYRPHLAVTRQAMSAFLARLADATLTDCTTPPFADVPSDHPFCREIKWMKDNNVSTGFDDGTYRPSIPVTRAAMSAFMYGVEPLLP